MLKTVQYKDVWKFTWHYWRKRRGSGILLLALMIAATLVDTAIPVFTGKIIDALISATPGDESAMQISLFYLGVFVVLGFTFHILRWFSNSLWAWFAVQCLYEILTDAMSKVQRFSADWHANAFAGGTVRKITRGMWSFDMFGDTLYVGLLPALIIMLGMTGMMLIKLPLVGLFMVVMIVIYCALSIWMALAILAERFQAAAQFDTRVGATLADIITGNPTVKAFAAENREEKAFNRVATVWRLRTQKAWMTSEVSNFVRGVLRTTMLSGMVGTTIWMWSKGQASPGDIALSLTSFFILGGYLRDIGQHISQLQKSVSEMEDVIAFWMRDDELSDAPGAKPIIVKQGEIVFDNVRFGYKNTAKPLFDGLSLTINPGEKIALVGHSGSGKSSFVKLVQRLYDAQQGEIRIDGQNIAGVTQESLRQNIALVPQEPILFHRSIAANIAYGRPGATREQIIAAAKQAYAHDFIEGLPLGYETLVGERGVKLSGGERQRVAIARAILADVKILILDEATSSLDSVSEHYIQKALAHLMEGRTTITIAHRLSTIRDADRILVFDAGRIIQQGRHQELIASIDAGYRTLYEMQVLGLEI